MSCSSDSDEEQNQVPEFDRSTILKNYAENIIIPRYDDFQSNPGSIKSSTLKHASTKSITTV